VFIQWVGEDVKPMTKGKISTHKSTVEKAFHVSFAINYDVFTSVRRLLSLLSRRNVDDVHLKVLIAITAHRRGSLKEPVLSQLLVCCTLVRKVSILMV